MTPAILLVEDNEDDQYFMKRALKRAGIRNDLHIVEDGRRAVSYLEGEPAGDEADAPSRPMIVFLDLKLPFLGGHDVLQWIREQPALQDLVVVILSSSSEPVDIERAYELKANHYLVKPPTAESLLEIVDRFPLKWRRG
jgi:CheY-like chemotaxis protein